MSEEKGKAGPPDRLSNNPSSPHFDMEAMQLGQGHRVVTIASGGCNILAYLTRSPERIDAVDLNAAHIALNAGDSRKPFGATLGQASRISGVNPADISVLMVSLAVDRRIGAP